MTPYEYEVVVRDRHVRMELECRLAQLLASQPRHKTSTGLAVRLRWAWDWIRRLPRVVRSSGAPAVPRITKSREAHGPEAASRLPREPEVSPLGNAAIALPSSFRFQGGARGTTPIVLQRLARTTNVALEDLPSPVTAEALAELDAVERALALRIRRRPHNLGPGGDRVALGPNFQIDRGSSG